MFSYNVDFLSQSVTQNSPTDMIENLSNVIQTSSQKSSLSPMDRSTGSPDSLRSETSSECPDSITDMLLSLQKQADVIREAKKTETEKPPHSYIALISMAILSSKEKKMVLAEIYEFVMKSFPYYNNQQKAWRNSIRHNLSINECFIKNGRADNGKGNFWSIHPACVEEFARGDYRRRQARRRARKGAKSSQKTQVPLSQIQGHSGYVPMTSSYFGFQPMSSSDYWSMPPPAGYHPLASRPNSYCTASSQLYSSPTMGYPPLSFLPNQRPWSPESHTTVPSTVSPPPFQPFLPTSPGKCGTGLN